MQSRFTFVLDDESVAVSGDPIRSSLAEFLGTAERFSGAPLLTLDHDAMGKPVIRMVDAARILLPAAAGRRFWSPSRLPETHPVVKLVAGHPEWCTDRRGRDWATAALIEAWHRSDESGADGISLDGWSSRTVDLVAVRDAARLMAELDGLGEWLAPFAEARSLEPVAKDDFAYVDATKERYYRPNTRSEAVRLQAQYPGDACVFSLDAVPEARMILNHGDRWEAGAALPLTSAIEALKIAFPLLGEIQRQIASHAFRNTIPLGEGLEILAPALMALDAFVRAISVDGERDIPLGRFFEGRGRTHLRPNELVGSVMLPVFKPAAGKARGAVSRVVSCVGEDAVRAGFLVECDRDRNITRAILAYSGIAEWPIRARETEQALAGLEWSEESLLGVLGHLGAEMDAKLSAGGCSERELEYRRQLVATLLQKFFHNSSNHRFV